MKPALHNDFDHEAVELLTCRVAGRDYALPTTMVREIRCWTRATQLPHSVPYAMGVINLRGRVLPVCDLGKRLGLPEQGQREKSVIIVVEVGDLVIGLRVDEVSDLLTVTAAELQDAPKVHDGGQPPFVKGLSIVGEQMIGILDLEGIARASTLAGISLEESANTDPEIPGT